MVEPQLAAKNHTVALSLLPRGGESEGKKPYEL